MPRILITLACAGLISCHPAGAQTLEGIAGHVVDGDTFDFRAIRIRICGIEAPDRGEDGHHQATMALSALIEGKRVHCIPVGAGSACDGRSKLFSHKRIVAQCFAEGADIAARMVQSGHACDWVKFSGGAYPGGCRK